ncbi:hypothetical protein GOP47_0002116 [Adiantum capillus-veneris]|uniref:Plastid lipid-associated protein/fibrillin conserved domain-containing protein n=1 Tax=Adiantum capillus-veneris TaxID=13818 RepID=A0A9D4ZNR8_ADICA|nr:hypothetical protein GOP47_0002116 [Adiantum capillus-veneris]
MATASPFSQNLATLQKAGRHDRRCLLKENARCVCFAPTYRFSPRSSTKAQASFVFVAVQEEAPAPARDSSSLKLDLLAMVAGLDRGLLASEIDRVKINTAAALLEDACGPLQLADGEGLQGRWRLVYSSAFASGSLGGRRPGPPVGLLPLTLGQVYQRVDVLARELDNIVELHVRSPWPLPPLDITATLAHSFEVIGDNTIKITFEKTSAKVGGQLPPFTLPQLPEFLRPSSSLRSGSFECTYLDENMRISRGDRGELRIFVMA